MRKPRKARVARPIAKLALQQRAKLNTDLDMDSPIGLPWREEAGRALVIPHQSLRGGSPPQGPPPPEKKINPCGCGGNPNPSAAQSAEPRLSPRQHLERFLDAQALQANRAKDSREAAQLQLFDDLVDRKVVR